MDDISNFFILDEEGNAIDYLYHAHTFLSKVKEDLYSLKWFIIAFHGAVYSFMLLTLQKVDSNQIYQEENPDKIKKTRTPMQEFEAQRVIAFLDAYKLLKKSKNMGGTPFTASNKIDSAMLLLNNELRNQIIHFKPMVSAYEPWYPAGICLSLIPILSLCISRSLNGQEKLDTENKLQQIKQLLGTHIT